MKIANFAIAFALIAAVVHADDRFEKNFSRTLDYRGGRVTIENRFGPIDIRTGTGRNVVVRATIRSSDAELGRNIRIETSDGPGGITIKTVMPSVISHHNQLSFSIDYDVVVPDEAPLYVSNHFGDIHAAGIRATSEFVNRQGSLPLRDSGGRQRVENSFGSITVEHATGSVDATNTNGSIMATHIDGKFAATNRFGSVTIDGGKGVVSATNANGSVDVRDQFAPM